MPEGTSTAMIYLVAKNAAMTLALSMPFAAFAAFFPAISTDTIFWSAAGGAMRWIALRSSLGDGLSGVGVGILMGIGLDGSNVPFLDTILPSAETVGHARPFLTAAFAVTVFGGILDYIKAKFGASK